MAEDGVIDTVFGVPDWPMHPDLREAALFFAEHRGLRLPVVLPPRGDVYFPLQTLVIQTFYARLCRYKGTVSQQMFFVLSHRLNPEGAVPLLGDYQLLARNQGPYPMVHTETWRFCFVEVSVLELANARRCCKAVEACLRSKPGLCDLLTSILSFVGPAFGARVYVSPARS